MALTQLAPPYPIFTDKSGSPLDNGYLYFGEVNKNPETNPIQVFYDSAFTQPAAQPLRTSNGYVMRNGSPALIYAGSQFSVTVRDKSNALVIYSPVGYGIDPGSVTGTVVYDDFTGNGSTIVFTLSASPSTKNATNVYIDGVYQSKDNYSTSGSTLTFSTAPPLNSAIEVVTQESSIIGGASSQQITYTQGGVGSVTRTVQSRLRDSVSVKDFGAVGDRVTDDTDAFEAAIAAVKASGPRDVGLYVPRGFYQISRPLDISRMSIFGPPGRAIIEATTSFPQGEFVFTYGITAAAGNDRCTMRDLDIDCGHLANGVLMEHRQFRIYGCSIRDPYDYAVKTLRNSQELWGVEIEGGLASSGLGIGVFVDGVSAGTSAGFRFDGCHIDTCKTGLKINEARVARVLNSTIQGCTRHIDIDANERIIGLVIENMYFEDTSTAGTTESIYINESNAADGFYYPISIKNCSFFGRNTAGTVCVRANGGGLVEFIGNNTRAIPYVFDYIADASTVRGVFEGNSAEPPATGIDPVEVFDQLDAASLTALRKYRFGPNEEWMFKVSGAATIANGSNTVTINHGMAITPERWSVSAGDGNTATGQYGFPFVSDVTDTTITFEIHGPMSIDNTGPNPVLVYGTNTQNYPIKYQLWFGV